MKQRSIGYAIGNQCTGSFALGDGPSQFKLFIFLVVVFCINSSAYRNMLWQGAKSLALLSSPLVVLYGGRYVLIKGLEVGMLGAAEVCEAIDRHNAKNDVIYISGASNVYIVYALFGLRKGIFTPTSVNYLNPEDKAAIYVPYKEGGKKVVLLNSSRIVYS